MANNKSIQLLRKNGEPTNTELKDLLPGQPLFDMVNGKLYIGKGDEEYSTISGFNHFIKLYNDDISIYFILNLNTNVKITTVEQLSKIIPLMFHIPCTGVYNNNSNVVQSFYVTTVIEDFYTYYIRYSSGNDSKTIIMDYTKFSISDIVA